ncbi:hypothetical protein [Nonomuraea sp. NPDC002799]
MTSTAEPDPPADRQPGPGLRSDAERNRERILAAARRPPPVRRPRARRLHGLRRP